EGARTNPSDYRARIALGAALGELQRWDEAIVVLQEAVALAPAVPAAHYNLGNALEKAGRIEAARRAYELALQVDPAHQRAGAALQRLLEFRASVGPAPATAATPSAAPPPPGQPAWPVLSVPPAAAPEGESWSLLTDA